VEDFFGIIGKGQSVFFQDMERFEGEDGRRKGFNRRKIFSGCAMQRTAHADHFFMTAEVMGESDQRKNS
jgi:hypothetical protein